MMQNQLDEQSLPITWAMIGTAIENKDYSTVKSLVQQIDSEQLKATTNRDIVFSLLMLAEDANLEEVVKILLLKLDPDALKAVTHLGTNALMFAAGQGLEEIAIFLLPMISVDAMNAQDLAGYTSLHLAADAGLGKLCKLLILKMSDQAINTISKFSGTALSAATKNGLLEVCEDLLPRMNEDSINAVDYSANTPLTWANKFGRIEIVKALIEYGAAIIIQPEQLASEESGVKTCVKLCKAARMADDIYSNRYNEGISLDQEAQEIFAARLKLHLTNYGLKQEGQKLLCKIKPILLGEIFSKLEDFLIDSKKDLHMYEANILGFLKDISPTPLLLIAQHNDMNRNWHDQGQKDKYFQTYSEIYPQIAGQINKLHKGTINKDEIEEIIEYLKNNQERYLSKISIEDITTYLPSHELDVEAIMNMILPETIKKKFEVAYDLYKIMNSPSEIKADIQHTSAESGNLIAFTGNTSISGNITASLINLPALDDLKPVGDLYHEAPAG
jgi:ankyrin repeat protein